MSFEGRSFGHVPASDDDGSAPPALLEALRQFRAGELGQAEVVDVIRASRLLIPLVAVRGEEGVGTRRQTVDKTQELSVVTVAARDGRATLPVFTSVAAMSAWNPDARPVPADGARVALAAAGESTELVVLDPGSETEFVIRRPALWAVAKGEPWTPSFLDYALAEVFLESARGEPAVRLMELTPGDPDARLAGPELMLRVTLEDGLTRDDLAALSSRLQERWSGDELVAERVDSLALRFVRAGP